MCGVAKVRTTLTVDDEVLKWVKIRAARTGKAEGEVIEQALRKDLGMDLLEGLWSKNRLAEEEANALAIEAQHKTRPRKR